MSLSPLWQFSVASCFLHQSLYGRGALRVNRWSSWTNWLVIESPGDRESIVGIAGGQAGTRRRTTDRSTIQIKFFRSSTVDLIRSPGGTEKESMVMFQVVPLTGTAAASCNPLYYYYYLSIRHAIQCQFMTPKNKCTSYTRDHVSLCWDLLEDTE